MDREYDYMFGQIKNLEVNNFSCERVFTIWHEEDMGFIDAPFSYELEIVDSNTLKVTPHDRLNDKAYLLIESDFNLVSRMILIVDRIKNTISVVKDYSTTEPWIYLDTDIYAFRYSFTLTGETFGDIFEKIKEMYFVITESTFTDDACITQKFLDQIQTSN